MATLALLILKYTPLFLIVVAYVVVYFTGKKKTTEIATSRIGALVKALKTYNFIVVGQPTAESIETYKLSLDTKNVQKVKAAAAWVELWPRKSFIHVSTQFLFHPKDHFILTMNFGNETAVWKPGVIIEIMPYSKKRFITQYFNYLVELDDIETGDPAIDDRFLIKTNDLRSTRNFIRSEHFLKRFNIIAPYIDYITIRQQEPHLECKFKFPNQMNVLTTILDLLQVLITEFARPRKGSKKSKVRKPTK